MDDWKQSRVREHLQQAERYSSFVSMMRWALPSIAAVILLMLFVWPNENGDVHSLPQSTASVREMVNLRYTGLNSKGDPMVVTAQRATQSGDMESPIDLETVKAELTARDGGWTRLESKTGVYNQKANHILLTGEVHLTDQDGYNIVTEKAEITLTKPSQAWGDKPVTGTGPQGNINANGFRITDEGKTMVFTGRSRLELPQGTK